MADAMRHGYKVLKPWGDSQPFDVALAFGNRIVRVQVKSTSNCYSTGYLCQFKPNYFSQPYSLDQLDFFAAYVITQDIWYLIPARIILGGEVNKQAIMVFPMEPIKKTATSTNPTAKLGPSSPRAATETQDGACARNSPCGAGTLARCL